ncbi:MAG: serine hydroxymethyltransferase [Candidatus Odinarchaeia archaeon]
MSNIEIYNRIFSLLESHHNWMKQTINLIASENVASPAVREATICDFSDRYAEGWPGERVYAGCKYIDEVEIICAELAKKLFKAEFVDVRPISGVVANLCVYAAFTNPGDRIMALSIPSGGHISSARKRLWGTAGRVHGLKVQYFPYNYEEMNIDVDKTRKKVKRLEKKGKHVDLFQMGGSVFLFPHPVKEISELAEEIGAFVNYDAAHVAGLIAGGQFQDPLREGADSMTCSTHKTLPGPQHGLVVSYNKYGEYIKKATFPGLVSNHHLHNVAGLAVVLAEMLEFGEKYAAQIVKNAKVLAQSLYELGFKVIAENKGFTESHTILVDITNFGDGMSVEKTLESANIIVNRNLLPWDVKEGRDYKHPGGIRLGVSEVTHLGMKESEMKYIAELIKRVIVDKENTKKIADEVKEFRKDFQKVHYCFDNARDAYEYIKIRC